MKKELSILQAYYKAMSSQDLNKAVSFLSDDVRVCFLKRIEVGEVRAQYVRNLEVCLKNGLHSKHPTPS